MNILPQLLNKCNSGPGAQIKWFMGMYVSAWELSKLMLKQSSEVLCAKIEADGYENSISIIFERTGTYSWKFWGIRILATHLMGKGKQYYKIQVKQSFLRVCKAHSNYYT